MRNDWKEGDSGKALLGCYGLGHILFSAAAMETLTTVVHSLIANFRARKFRVPREMVAPFLDKLHEIFSDEGMSEEEKVLLELLRNLLQQRIKLNSAGANNVLINLANVADVLFANILSQTRLIRKTEGEHLLHNIQELQSIVSGMVESKAAFEEDNDALAFGNILRDQNYITHYEARGPKSSLKKVIVVVWDNRIPGPTMIHDGMYVLYYYCPRYPKESSESWDAKTTLPIERQFSPFEMEEAASVSNMIEKHQSSLFDKHSNLVAIKSSGSTKGKFYIDFIVLAKGFVPVKDKTELPRFLEGIPTRVSSGIVQLCGLQERIYHRPIVPGAGFAAGPDARLNLAGSDAAYNPPVLSTLGGRIRRGNDTFAIGCAHGIRKHGSNDLHPAGTPIFQPCAMGLIQNGITPGLKTGRENIQANKGEKRAMVWLLDQVHPPINPTLPQDAQCGTVQGGIFGHIPGRADPVDCALIRLTTDMVDRCRVTPIMDNPPIYPELRLGDGATPTFLDIQNPPNEVFTVYGQGAMSEGIMQAQVNPDEEEGFFRIVEGGDIGFLQFRCVHALYTANWQPGDSGTWCWTADGALVGMGMAYNTNDNGDKYCCILPMADVIAAAEHILAEA